MGAEKCQGGCTLICVMVVRPVMLRGSETGSRAEGCKDEDVEDPFKSNTARISNKNIRGDSVRSIF